ncbi:hypothetical protein F4780DRAFT_734171 [Xylariomycetidae sp. FL0641]|nr:hypothetical protein F4780DRAFT_734171 [Xylariomycetidae sp. FL0641]
MHPHPHHQHHVPPPPPYQTMPSIHHHHPMGPPAPALHHAAEEQQQQQHKVSPIPPRGLPGYWEQPPAPALPPVSTTTSPSRSELAPAWRGGSSYAEYGGYAAPTPAQTQWGAPVYDERRASLVPVPTEMFPAAPATAAYPAGWQQQGHQGQYPGWYGEHQPPDHGAGGGGGGGGMY